MKNIKVHFKTRNGQIETVEAPEFNTLMEASRYYSKNGYIDSIDADCGGACSCATCHVWIDEKWIDKVGKPKGDSAEQELLDYDPLMKAIGEITDLPEPLSHGRAAMEAKA